ncbi:MAG: hypothetical protein K2N54_01145 [Helicobacter sp.]|nr:hypothetical protein [Helicobacter sp.]
MCVALAYVNSPQRFVYVMPFGSNIDVARCGWEIGIKSNGKEMFRLCLNMTRFQVSLRASATSVAINRQRIPTHRAFKDV